MFIPKSLICLREGYSRESVTRDVIAGLVVGVVALPLALAFAIASGVPPERGLYTAIVAGFLISALGGSRVQIGGPTGAFVVIVYGVVAKHGYDGLAVCTILAGLILIALGLARMGALIKFIPYPVVTGFTSGIAVIIFSSQVKDFFGLRMEAVPPDFIAKWLAYRDVIGTLHWPAISLALGTLLLLIVWPRISQRVPGPFVAMVAATLAVQFFDIQVETIGSRFGAMPTGLPLPRLPQFQWTELRELISPAVTIALLAAIESLLSAVVADGMLGTRHKSNMELIAQGAANVVSPIFGGIPATGAIARTATNIRSGGRTPLAGLVHAATLLLILLFAGRWAARVPLASLAAILVMVSYHMSEWRSFAGLLRAPKSDIFVLVVTFALTVFVDLTVAVQVGVVAAALLFMRRMAEVTSIEGVATEMVDADASDDPNEISHIRRKREIVSGVEIPKGVGVYAVNGPFFFGAAEKLTEVIAEIAESPQVLIVRMAHVPAIDATGIHALEQLFRKCRRQGTMLILSEVRSQPRAALAKAGADQIFNEMTETFDAAVATAAARMAGTPPPHPPSAPSPPGGGEGSR